MLLKERTARQCLNAFHVVEKVLSCPIRNARIRYSPVDDMDKLGQPGLEILARRNKAPLASKIRQQSTTTRLHLFVTGKYP